MEKRKSFFEERRVGEIKRLKIKEVSRQKGLVELIDGLSTDEGLILRTRIIPGKFFHGGVSGAEAGRKFYKHGPLIALPQPQKYSETLNSRDTPLDLRERALTKLREMKETEIYYIGCSWRPVFGNDRTKRIVPFVWFPEGVKIFTYAERYSAYKEKNKEKQGIKVQIYGEAKRAETEGATAVVEVPSRTEKKPKYKFALIHIPFIPNNPEKNFNFNLAIALSLRSSLVKEESLEPAIGRMPHQEYDIGYKFSHSKEWSDVIRFYPHEIAGYLGVIKQQIIERHNITPLMFNPFILPSKHQAEFYQKLCNNILIFDPTIKSKEKLRKLNLAEKSILLGRATSIFGHSDFAYWDSTRDGIFRDYVWNF